MVIDTKVAVVLNARNEEKHLAKTLEYLLNQDLKTYRIIVVNDGSTDKTEDVATSFKEMEVINREKRKENFVAKKELAITINTGLEKLDDDIDCNFILLMNADILLPKNYLSILVNRMKSNPNLVIAGGVLEEEFSEVPRGSGRVIRYDFWKKLGLRYPVNYGYEGYLLWKAQSMGYEIKIFSDLVYETQRKTGSEYEPKRYYYYGLGLKALGYSFLYAIARIFLFSKRKPRGAYYMLKGFLSNYGELYELELREYVRKTQNQNIFSFKQNYFKRFFRTLKYSK